MRDFNNDNHFFKLPVCHVQQHFRKSTLQFSMQIFALADRRVVCVSHLINAQHLSNLVISILEPIFGFCISSDRTELLF
jgi:hypothetical protein